MADVRRWPSGRRISPRSYWCRRGSMIVVVKAHTAAEARRIADRRFAVAGRRLADGDLVKVRVASRADLALWADLLAQQQLGAAGLVVTEMEGQGGLFEEAS